MWVKTACGLKQHVSFFTLVEFGKAVMVGVKFFSIFPFFSKPNQGIFVTFNKVVMCYG